ncbi:hypothetical protein ACIHCQ_41140 [Streptomyces sp. NPDC052236]|uniref:hypothetical protein n=1 Tax=Streptomyces sp. NPDC052236 TaxID=3365686 RepID=UPI0037CE56B4
MMQDFDIDQNLYFTHAETKDIKKSLTGINHTLDGLKLGLALVAATAQIIKVDLSVWKIDEKGISIGGIQTRTWPWAKEESWLWKKVSKDVDNEIKKRRTREVSHGTPQENR